MTKSNTTKITSANAVLAVKIYPKKGAETVILLHGGPGVPDQMPEITEILQEGYQVIYFEQRGVGESVCGDADYSMEEYIGDIDAIAGYFELKTFHLLGHSWGGLYAQIYAQKNPQRIKSLFLVSPGSGTGADWEMTKAEVMALSRKSVSSLGWMKMGINSVLGLLGSDAAFRKLYNQVVQNYNKGYGGGGLPDEILQKINAGPINKTAKEISSYPTLKKIDNPGFPITITYGDNDIYGESKNAVRSRFPTAEFIMIDNSGHFPWQHNPALFGKVLREFYKIEPVSQAVGA